MKTKLLKKLRKKFYVAYYPGRGQYKLSNDGHAWFFCKKSEAIASNRYSILKYGRKYYFKYSKRYVI